MGFRYCNSKPPDKRSVPGGCCTEDPPARCAYPGACMNDTMTKDLLPLRRIDHVRFFVGNARQSAYFYRNAFGFEVLGYAGLETGVKNEAGYVLRQGHITFILTSPLTPTHPENQRLAQHGDGVMDIALEVDDVRTA